MHTAHLSSDAEDLRCIEGPAPTSFPRYLDAFLARVSAHRRGLVDVPLPEGVPHVLLHPVLNLGELGRNNLPLALVRVADLAGCRSLRWAVNPTLEALRQSGQ